MFFQAWIFDNSYHSYFDLLFNLSSMILHLISILYMNTFENYEKQTSGEEIHGDLHVIFL